MRANYIIIMYCQEKVSYKNFVKASPTLCSQIIIEHNTILSLNTVQHLTIINTSMHCYLI